MPTFAPNQPIVTQTPAVVVEAGLQPGEYTFQLIVEDEAGNTATKVYHLKKLLKLQRGVKDE